MMILMTLYVAHSPVVLFASCIELNELRMKIKEIDK